MCHVFKQQGAAYLETQEDIFSAKKNFGGETL